MRIAVMAAGAVGGYYGGRLAAAGHDVTVVTGFPFAPRWKRAAEYRGELVRRETVAGINSPAFEQSFEASGELLQVGNPVHCFRGPHASSAKLIALQHRCYSARS